jgi:hypothetical protein
MMITRLIRKIPIKGLMAQASLTTRDKATEENRRKSKVMALMVECFHHQYGRIYCDNVAIHTVIMRLKLRFRPIMAAVIVSCPFSGMSIKILYTINMGIFSPLMLFPALQPISAATLPLPSRPLPPRR